MPDTLAKANLPFSYSSDFMVFRASIGAILKLAKMLSRGVDYFNTRLNFRNKQPLLATLNEVNLDSEKSERVRLMFSPARKKKGAKNTLLRARDERHRP